MPELHVKLSLPRARYDKAAAAGLRLKLTAKLAPHMAGPVSFHRRGTIFDDLCPLLGRGGYWGVADASRKPVHLSAPSTSASAPGAGGEPREQRRERRERKPCVRIHTGDDGFLEFGDRYVCGVHLTKRVSADDRASFVTLHPGQEYVVEKLLPARELAALNSGQVYTLYSRPDREKKRPARVPRCKWGTREELAESAFWCSEEEDGGTDAGDSGGGGGEGGDEAWTKIDVSHIVRDRKWFEMVVLVGNSVRFHVV